jgi:CO/xanthine dehydrogenase FAD-binding subunit
MIPPRRREATLVSIFEYKAANSVGEAVDLLKEYGDDAKVLAGGQSLIALINLGLAQPSVLVDIGRIAELNHIDSQDGWLSVGATTRHATALASEDLRRQCPLLGEALPLIGDPQVRNRGTLGGSIAHADPAAELPTVASCLGATMRVQSRSGTRDVAASEFFAGYLTTTMPPGELLTEIRFPVSEPNTGFAFLELVRRKGDFAIVAAAAAISLAPDGVCSKVQLALAGVGPTPVLATEATGVLEGHAPTADLIGEAARAACSRIDPESDVIASADYRRAMAEVYARRALTQAAGLGARR